MANPFGFNGTNNPFIATVLFPAIKTAAEIQTQSSSTYGGTNSKAQNKLINKANSGEWVPSDYAKVKALYAQRRGRSATFADPTVNGPETESLIEQANAVAEGREPPPDIVDRTVSGQELTFADIVSLSERSRFGNQTYLGESLSQRDVDSLLENETATSLDTLQKRLKDRSVISRDHAKSQGRFTEVDRLPFVLTCQKWINEASGVSDTSGVSGAISDSVKTGLTKATASLNTKLFQDAAGAAEAEKYIFCNVNPSQISWSFPVRAVDQMTLGGRVQHVWRSPKRKNSYFDEPTIRFTFQSGNIMPLKYVDDVDGKGKAVINNSVPGMPAGLSNFHKFFELFDQPRILDTQNNKREVNLIYIFYNSRVFPRMTLTGLWTPEGISFDENAEDPNQITWSASFTVYDSYPKFSDPKMLTQSFIDAGFGGTRVTDGAVSNGSRTSRQS